jgi:hypothetical protein
VFSSTTSKTKQLVPLKGELKSPECAIYVRENVDGICVIVKFFSTKRDELFCSTHLCFVRHRAKYFHIKMQNDSKSKKCFQVYL